MDITRPAGRDLTVSELLDLLARAHRNDAIRLVVNDRPVGVALAVGTVGAVEPIAEPVEPADIAAGEHALKQAKEQARLVLANAGIKVQA